MLRASEDASTPHDIERDLLARDSYRSHAFVLSVLTAWIAVVSRFGVALSGLYVAGRYAFAALSLIGLGYIAWTWQRPRHTVAVAFMIFEVLSVQVLVVWLTWAAANVGERWEPIAALQLAMAATPFVAATHIWAGYPILGLFAADLVLAELYQQHVGLGPLAGAEPFGSLTVVLAAMAVLLLRTQRQRVMLARIRTQSEASALLRLEPLLTSIGEKLVQATHALDAIAHESTQKAGAFPRAIERLDTLRNRLDALRAPGPEPVHGGERGLLARDAQMGSFIFAVFGVAALAFSGWSTKTLPVGYATELSWRLAILYAVVALWLRITRSHPTIRRGVLAAILLLSSAQLLAMYMHSYWVQLDDLVFPFLGEKLIMMTLVVVRFPRLWIGVLLLVIIAISQIAIQVIFATAPIPLSPWHMLMFAAIGLGFLVMGEQRRIASIALLSAETTRSSLYRHADLSLALCDQLNTPLQTVMVIVSALPTSASTIAAMSRIEDLRTASQDLTRHVEELPPELRRLSLDGALDLMPRVAESAPGGVLARSRR
jgi:hypothetical protein